MHTPITALYAGILAIVFFLLSMWVITFRWRYRIGIGHGDHPDMLRAVRVHANFSEYVPLVVGLILIQELNGQDVRFLHAQGAALLLGRLAHAWGLSRSSFVSVGRFGGTTLTFSVLFFAAVACIRLF